MGTYLSTPVTEKNVEEGSTDRLQWAVVDMQGWRKSMEDSHIASHTAQSMDVFAVFDGHGGPEVARFAQLYLVSCLHQAMAQQAAQNGDNREGNIGQALIDSFHALDRMIDDPGRRNEMIDLRTKKPAMGEVKEATNIPEPKPIAGEAPTPNTDSEPPLTTKGSEDTPSFESVSLVTELVSDKVTSLEEVAEDDDSTEATGLAEAAREDQLEDEEDNDDTDVESADDLEEDDVHQRVTAMFQKLISLGQVEPPDGSEGEAAPRPEPSASLPSIKRNGRHICNLPDHPIHAGATAIVAVLAGDVLTVANAGDSRGVLCRAGTAVALSYDHKPLQGSELNRIKKAGGFVNQFGRVNGNLNLSRAIGDLKYKQIPGLEPKEQIISAEPDIMRLQVQSDDEFIILGCDGVWDCLSNQEAVDYVRSRIDRFSPVEIGKEMLGEIISVDPRKTQGIGGDNMTVLIVDLQPQSRPHYGNSNAVKSVGDKPSTKS